MKPNQGATVGNPNINARTGPMHEVMKNQTSQETPKTVAGGYCTMMPDVPQDEIQCTPLPALTVPAICLMGRTRQ
jgi:hypothetical protein